jgi:hypothetical protein
MNEGTRIAINESSRIKFVTVPIIPIKMPIIKAEINKRCSSEKFSFSPRMYLIVLLILSINASHNLQFAI